MSAHDNLFAAKGSAQPVNQTISADDPAIDAQATTSADVSAEKTPLPDLFGEPANEETAGSSPDVDDDALDGEPAPAASLLTIVSQRSAARRRTTGRVSLDTQGASTQRSGPPTPDIANDTDSGTGPTVIDTPGANTETDGSPATNLPVRVQVQLPMVIHDGPVLAKSGRDRRLAALAACVAISIAGAIAILIAGSGEESPTTAPSAAIPAVATPASVVDAPVGEPPAQIPVAPVIGITGKTFATIQEIEPEPTRTTIQSVRINEKGQAIVSGLAPPEAALIVLHNRQPLGTAQSDAAGVWTFSARVPTRANRNEIYVVPMRIDNSVMVTDLPAIPRPSRRPAIPSFYFAQIASLPSAADAGREAAKLADRLNGIVARHRISVRVATIENGRKVYRVAIGGFSTKTGAADICNRVRARNARCLVMRGS